MTALKLFFNNMHNKEHEDYQFIKNTSYAFIGRTLMFIAIGLSLVFEIINFNKMSFDIIVLILFSLFLISDLSYFYSLMKIYYELGNNQEFQSKFITSRVERRFWKFYNRSNYGWKFMGSYYHPRSYYEGVTRAKSNPTLGESLMAGVKPAARLTKSLFDPLYKKQNRKKLAKTSLAIDCINKKAKRAIIRPEDKSNLDDFDQFKYESSYDYRKKGDRDYDDGFYDQSRYESYYEDYY